MDTTFQENYPSALLLMQCLVTDGTITESAFQEEKM